MSWEKKKYIYIYCPDHSSLGIALRHLRVSITDHNSLLETNSWGKAAGWKRLDCFTSETGVPGYLVSIFFSHSGMLTALRGLPLPPSHSHVPSAASRGALEIGCAGKFGDLDRVEGVVTAVPSSWEYLSARRAQKSLPFLLYREINFIVIYITL